MAAENDSRADTHGKIATYLATFNVVRLFEDLTAFLVQHHPEDPWKFLATHFERILPEVKAGACPQTLLRDMEVVSDRPSVIDNPRLYTRWLNENGVFEALEEAARGLAVEKVPDPHTAILEFIQEQTIVRRTNTIET